MLSRSARRYPISVNGLNSQPATTTRSNTAANTARSCPTPQLLRNEPTTRPHFIRFDFLTSTFNRWRARLGQALSDFSCEPLHCLDWLSSLVFPKLSFPAFEETQCLLGPAEAVQRGHMHQ